MKSSFPDSFCPACQHVEVVEHIEVAPVEGRAKGIDRRGSVDLAYLSLIEVDRRNSQTDRRSLNTNNMVVEHQQERNMVCLTCAYEWYADSSFKSLMQ